MKITMYELLGLIQCDEAPNTIRYKNNIYKYDGETRNYRRPINLTFDFLIGEDITALLNDEVEIIEEPKKIEKITVREKTLGFPNGEWTARNMDKAFAIKINELIDEINNLKEK